MSFRDISEYNYTDSRRLADFNSARTALCNLISKPVAAGVDGFQPDASFVQHGYVAYTGAYGVEMYFQCAWMIYLLDGKSDTRLPPRNWNQLTEWTWTAFAPFMFCGAISNAVMGRAIGRSFTTDHS